MSRKEGLQQSTHCHNKGRCARVDIDLTTTGRNLKRYRHKTPPLTSRSPLLVNRWSRHPLLRLCERPRFGTRNLLAYQDRSTWAGSTGDLREPSDRHLPPHGESTRTGSPTPARTGLGPPHTCSPPKSRTPCLTQTRLIVHLKFSLLLWCEGSCPLRVRTGSNTQNYRCRNITDVDGECGRWFRPPTLLLSTSASQSSCPVMRPWQRKSDEDTRRRGASPFLLRKDHALFEFVHSDNTEGLASHVTGKIPLDSENEKKRFVKERRFTGPLDYDATLPPCGESRRPSAATPSSAPLRRE